MTTARSTVGVAVLNGRLYAVGGRDGLSCLNSMECYDPHTNKWTATCPMLKRRGGENRVSNKLRGKINKKKISFQLKIKKACMIL